MTSASSASGAENLSTYSLTPPELLCPFPSKINPHTAEAHQRSLAWGERFGLLETTEIRRQQLDERYTWLVGRAFPRASASRLQLLCDWTSWLFWHDDVCDETALGKDPERLSQQFDRFFGVLTGTGTPRSNNPFDIALVDLISRFRAMAPDPAWTCRFIISVQEYFQACVWEASNRASHKIPSIDEFISMRRCAGGAWIFIDFLEFAHDHVLPLELRKNSDVQRLMQIMCDIACWHNDIYSWPKEMRRNDVHNLVAVLKEQFQFPLDEAIDRAAGYCDTEIREFLAIVSSLRSSRSTLSGEFEQYVDGMQSVMRGNLDWARESGRYKHGAASDLHSLRVSEVLNAEADDAPA